MPPGKRAAEDSVGLKGPTTWTHTTSSSLHVTKDGHVLNEGDIQVGVSPYPISYRSIVPKATQCTNLLVPVYRLAASHIAYGSIRMEPVFHGNPGPIGGHGRGGLAIDGKLDVQKVDYPKLTTRLLEDVKSRSSSGGAGRSVSLRSMRRSWPAS